MTKLGKILVDFDNGYLSDDEVETILVLAKSQEAAVTLLVTRPLLDELTSESDEAFFEQTTQQVEQEYMKIHAKAEVSGVDLALAIEAGESSVKLMEYGKVNQFDLLVIGRRHTGGIQNAIFGTTWKQVVINAEVPVLVMP